jgi:hypothetical protein
MAITYLRHPQHGTKVASMEAEVDHDYKHGWEEYDPNETQVIEEAPVVENALAPRSRRKTVQ